MAVLLYDSRSGSTYFSRILDEQEGISVSVESTFFVHLMEMECLDCADKIINHLIKKDFRFKNIFSRPKQFYKCFDSLNHPTPYDVARCIMSAHFPETDRSSIWIIKCGMFLHHLIGVAEYYPRMRFLHILRDGRAVLNSKMHANRVYRKGKMAEDVFTPARVWRGYVTVANRTKAACPDRLLEVRYESLLTSQENEIRRVRRFLNLSEEPRSKPSDRSSGYFNRIPDAEKSLHHNVEKEGIIANVDKWKIQLSKPDVMLYEYLNGDQLRSKQYELIYSPEDKRHSALFWFNLVLNLAKHISLRARRKWTQLRRKAGPDPGKEVQV
ncbi:MAG: sulfotransferase family protein [Desulfobacterales bacterium]